MTYQWKLNNLYPVSAQVAGEELERIYEKRGQMAPADVVDESRPEDAPLHPCFEWRDPVAAELWREQQARNIVSCIVTVQETPEREVTTRAFAHVEGSYHPISVVIQSVDKLEGLKQTAFRELQSFRQKYQAISELAPVFDAIDNLEGGKNNVGKVST